MSGPINASDLRAAVEALIAFKTIVHPDCILDGDPMVDRLERVLQVMERTLADKAPVVTVTYRNSGNRLEM